MYNLSENSTRKRPGPKQEKERTSEWWAKSKSQLFFQFSPPALPPSLVPLYGSHLSCSQPEERGVRFIRLTCVCRVQTTLCAEIIDACVYGCISVYTNFIYVRLYICVQILYTCLLFRRCFIRRLEPPRKIFTTVKTADVCGRPVSVLRPTEKGQHALIVILGIRRTLGQNSLDTGTVEG